MAVKDLDDFGGDYQAYADYLESAECANDMGYDVYADEKGNIYEPTDGDWTKGHGHKNVFAEDWEGRDKDDEASKGRPWKNPWLKYDDDVVLSKTELQFINNFDSRNNSAEEIRLTRKK